MISSNIRCFFLLLIFMSAGWTIHSRNAKIPGYKGIWYTVGQSTEFGYKYSGGLGTYTADHIPQAIYVPEVDKTFFTYGGTTRQDERHLLVMISYFDHKKGVVPKPVIVCDKVGVDDPHDNASLSVDDEGFIWVFVSGRNVSRLGMIFKSSRPYDIDCFEKICDSEMTYPQPWRIKECGFVNLFTRYTAPNHGRELYRSVSLDGKTWSSDQKLAGMGGHYQISNIRGSKIATAFNYHPGGHADKRTNIYFVQTEDMGETWKTIDGEILQTPLTDIHGPALIHNYEAEGKLVYLNDLNFDKNGNPVILAIISNDFRPGPQGNPREWIIFLRENNRWEARKVCESSHNYDMGSLYINKNEWLIIGPTEEGPQKYGTGGEMAVWKSTDEGRSWKKERDITQNSRRNHSYARRPLNADKDFYAYWADGNADEFSESRLYFTNKKGDKVWVLPYHMESDFAKPVRLK